MKIKIEIDEGLPEDEVLIRCRGLTEQIADVQKAVSEVINTSQKFIFYRGNTEYYLTDEGKGAGPFIMAYSEVLKAE